ncbi:hypothetical protein GRX03_12045 [Halovenus sp. WSH3]|uniref:Copper resistance protein D domain-containing protein n=1 Tax=Halovenus carboxidivorans TaxID=2692199 RepID=A0A6B0TAS3_9EURY|nr:CopD family protein [Halovenus carboxidivorans]MXR52331.1 hypothetical protein [Halovenus carboxidivorans]
MGQSQHESVETGGTELFDRYTLPKVALTIILVASLAGTTLTLRLSGVGAVAVVLAKWGYLVALGVLVGGLCWKHLFVRPQDLDDTGSYCERMYDRFESVGLYAAGALALSGVVVLPRYWRSTAGPAVSGLTALVFAGLLVTFAATLFRSGSVDGQFRSPLGLAAFGSAVGLLVATAAAEVSLRGGAVDIVAVRTLHLLAFALWVGGAVWNIFVAVPVGQESPTVPVVRAAGQQLERFRWVVRFVFPTVVVTGLYQAHALFGWNASIYLHSTLGRVIVGKLGLIVVLFVIFKLCPMWRACSPIEGVCDLEELGGGEVSGDD